MGEAGIGLPNNIFQAGAVEAKEGIIENQSEHEERPG